MQKKDFSTLASRAAGSVLPPRTGESFYSKKSPPTSKLKITFLSVTLWGTPSLVNFDIFLLHGVAASLRAIPMSQSSAPPPSVAPGPDFCFDKYEESEVCQFAILRTRPPEEAVLHGGPGAALALPSPEDPARVCPFDHQKLIAA